MPAKKKTIDDNKEIKEAVSTMPSEIESMLLQDADMGLGDVSKDDFAIPRLNILQSLSPQVLKRGDSYVDGAEPSMILDNVSNTAMDGEQGIIVVPVAYRRTIIEWVTRDPKGGGGEFVADHGLNESLIAECTKDDKGRFINADGNQLVETAEYYVFVVNGKDYQPAVISMSSTQMKKSKRWNTLIDGVRADVQGKRVRAPMFYMSYLLTTIPESKGEFNWFGWEIKKNGKLLDLECGDEIYLSARDFRQQIDDGEVKVKDHVNEDAESDESPM